MLKLTYIARISDSLPLAESIDEKEGDDEINNQRKKIMEQLSLFGSNSNEKISIDSGSMVFHSLTSMGVIYMTLCEKSYSSQMAYNFLEELKKEFEQLYSSEVHKVERPYAFMKFDTFIQKTRRIYTDSRTKRNIQTLKDELNDVHQIIKKNLSDVIGRGEELNQMSNMSNEILDGAKKFKTGATELAKLTLWKKYKIPLIILGILIFLILLRYILF
ncbi:predicted protein [Naegleria gruberi]|uniref:Predicted protein n=1 Tax=Naegleria gruberi TaxID=5762 RepID=D2VIH0_NAEGR|nr:uncharacterized protein NAEGRDRAFT_44614 [Naegleria gruberi]EFC43355.1 predicted protein [Naegleria gruberi]|eukprot:XP_002676099.1 predicted protein [Naegleria gruberi strain NEG-M]